MEGSLLMSWMMFFHPKEHILKISFWYLNWKCIRKGLSRRGGLGGHWGFLRGDFKDRGHSWHHEWSFFTPRKIPWKFCADIAIRSVSGRGGQEGGYLDDIEGSWSEKWSTWSLVIPDVIDDVFLPPRKIPLKLRLDISIRSDFLKTQEKHVYGKKGHRQTNRQALDKFNIDMYMHIGV